MTDKEIAALRRIALKCCDHDTTDALDRLIAKAERALSAPAAPEPAIHWPQVVAYPGGNGGLGAWVDISTGDGPEAITRFHATPRSAQRAGRVEAGAGGADKRNVRCWR